MKKRNSVIAFLLCLSMLLLAACSSPADTSTQPGTTTTGKTQVTVPTGTTNQTQPTQPPELGLTDLYIVGDSTACSFTDSYFYPRYGFGTQLANYLDERVTVHNLAISGRSSKSFLTEANYQLLVDSLQPGDYLLIVFGHNDQKSDDAARFTDATKDYTDPASFGYHLYEYYIKLAQEKGATPILCTPIVRLASDNDYSGAEAHVTATGNYRQAILDLAAAVDVPVVDLTGLTAQQYTNLGYDVAILYHAIYSGKYADDGVTIEPVMEQVDKTHLNIYGAKYIAYLLATQLKQINPVGGYVREDIQEPTVADLTPNPDYVVTDYVAPDLENYVPASQFTTMSPGWYGTAFGNTGGNPQSAGNGFVATETAEGVFRVGQTAGSNKGKFESGSDGFAFLFRQVDVSRNFSLTVTASVVTTGNTKQAGFGLMLRDDVVIDQQATSTISSNYVTAGVLASSDSSVAILFSRENGKLQKGDNIVDGLYAEGDVLTMTIERIGQSVTTTVVYNGVTYTQTYVDFDFQACDSAYMYIGMFANRGTIVEFTNVVFQDLGTSQGA